RAALARDDRAAVHLAEVTVGEQVPALGALVLLRVLAEEPEGVLAHPLLVDDLVAVIRRGGVLAPVVAFVGHEVAGADEAARVRERVVVESDGHGSLLPSSGLRAGRG